MHFFVKEPVTFTPETGRGVMFFSTLTKIKKVAIVQPIIRLFRLKVRREEENIYWRALNLGWWESLFIEL